MLRSGKVNYWTGKKGREFEDRFAQWQGSKYAISVNSGTSALHVGLAALGIGPGDEVIVPSYSFIASSFSICQAGAIPRPAGRELEDHCISVESAAKLVNERTRAIMPVHLYGNVADMDEINAFARKHNLFVIEDNAEAFGGEYKGRKPARWATSWRAVFAEQDVHDGGEGGMVTTDNEDLAWEARSFRDHGYDVKARLSLLELEQTLPYIHNRVGWNYRMILEMQSIGLAELDRMDDWNMPAPAQRAHRDGRAERSAAGAVRADRHDWRTAERLVRDGAFARYREHEVRYRSVCRGGGREGGPRAGRCSGRSAIPRRRS